MSFYYIIENPQKTNFHFLHWIDAEARAILAAEQAAKEAAEAIEAPPEE